MRTWVDSRQPDRGDAPGGRGSPLPAERETLALATAIRVFERFSVLDTVVLAGGEGEVSVSRAEVERVLAPEGFECAPGPRPLAPGAGARAPAARRG